MEEICISHNGADNNHCGSTPNCCKTILFTIRTIAQENDTVVLENIADRSIEYRLTEPVMLHQSVYIKKKFEQHANPTIAWHDKSLKNSTYAFIMNSSAIKLSIESINFMDINIISCLRNNCSVHLKESISNFKNCIYSPIKFSSSIDDTASILLSSKQDANIIFNSLHHLTIEKSQFMHPGCILESPSNTNVDIYDSTFIGGCLSARNGKGISPMTEDKPASLFFKNVRFPRYYLCYCCRFKR